MSNPSQRSAATRFAFALLFLLPFLQAHAQSATGVVSGTVMDAATGKFLEGADVTVDDGTAEVSTGRDGRFTFGNLPAGAHTVTVKYPGFDAATSNVTVTAGSTASVPVRLGGSNDVIKLSEFKVAGTKEGMAQAIAIQRAAPNLKVVAASDQYGDISEGNAAEYLKFLPGIGIDYNANDARAVTLRGMSTQFTNVLMDGTPIASATSGNLNRRFEFEQVAINNVETIEVVKTLTPDIMATSTGGNINLVTKSAFDHENNLLTYRAYFQAINDDLTLKKTEGWGQERTRKVLPGLDLVYSFRPRQDLGVVVAYKNSQLFNDYPRSSYGWDYSTANGGSPSAPILTSWNLQNEQKDTRRQALSTRFDYKLSDATKISLLADWNFYDLLFTDRVITVNTGAAPTRGANGTVNGAAGKGSVALQMINRWKSGVTWDLPLTITHDFSNGSRLTGSGYWSQAYSKYRDTTGSWYSDMTITRGGTTADPLTVSFSNVGEVAPRYTVTDGSGATVDLNDVTKYRLTQLRSRPQTGVDTRYGYSADYKIDLPLPVQTTVTVGGRNDYNTRNIFDPVFSATPTLSASQLTSIVDTGFSQHSIGYGLPAYNFPSVYRAYDVLGGTSLFSYKPGQNGEINARFEDHTPAGYVRVDVKPMRDLLLIGGVRYEDRQTTSINRVPSSAAPNGVQTVFTDKSWYPSLNFKYDLMRKVTLRGGFSRTIGLPDYSDLLPALTITNPSGSSATGSVNIYNPGLQAYRVNNYDLGIEYDYSSTGFVAASVFRKDLKNYIASVSQQLTPDLATSLGVPTAALSSPVSQYNVTYKLNVPETGTYNGIELQASQNLKFLPKPFNTLSVQANATFLKVDPMDPHAVFNPTDSGANSAIRDQIRKNLELSSVKQSYNVTLNYSYKDWGLTIVSNYTGKVLKTISQKTVTPFVAASGSTPAVPGVYYNELQYQAPRALVDVRLEYKWRRWLTPYLEIRNIFGRPIVMSTQSVTFNHAEYGDPIYELGVRGVW